MDSYLDEAHEIFLKNILPEITRAFSAITYKMTSPLCLQDEEEAKRTYHRFSERIKETISDYIDSTSEAQFRLFSFPKKDVSVSDEPETET